ncbi:ester cyclase [Sphingomonas kyeonggiensis]|nr:ester cyclase [Sphingomonas kyeonggiensis]
MNMTSASSAPVAAIAQAALSAESARILVQPIYDALTASAPDLVRGRLEAATTSDWQNCATEHVCETRETAIERWSARIERVPDFRFVMREVLVSGNRIIVRGEAIGTPAVPFMGVSPSGRSFRLMTIDIHEIVDGKVHRTYHLEDWARALRQLRGEEAL